MKKVKEVKTNDVITEVKKSDNDISKKKKKYRGKKKKKAGEDAKQIISVPRLKNLQQENISSNWKNLMQTIIPSEKSASKATQKSPTDFKKYKSRSRKPKKDENSTESEGKKGIWFDDVDHMLLEEGEANTNDKPEKFLVKENSFAGITKILAMDCEMVGVGRGGEDSILARVSIVNHFGNLVYDTFVAATERVTDYRTAVSGVRPQDIADAPDFKTVQQKVSELIKGRILVGHAIHHDFKVLYLDHPRQLIRDTSKYKPFRAHFGGKTPGLKKLTERYIGVQVQTGEHSSVQDAQATMRLYTLVRTDWEKMIQEKSSGKFHNKKPGAAKKKPDLNNKSELLAGIQKDLSKSGTRQYVDSDSE